jgi:hypothetical protein
LHVGKHLSPSPTSQDDDEDDDIALRIPARGNQDKRFSDVIHNLKEEVKDKSRNETASSGNFSRDESDMSIADSDRVELKMRTIYVA